MPHLTATSPRTDANACPWRESDGAIMHFEKLTTDR
jgi:hypothetical protein